MNQMLDYREKKQSRLSGRKPSWLRSEIPAGENYVRLKQMIKERGLHTICEEGKCPNLGECWGGGTATFMLMGDVCTRGCRFCNVLTRKQGSPLDPQEPFKVAEAACAMNLDYIVITSVDRDDLPDGGAAHFAATIEQIHLQSQESILIEVLTPDFHGKLADVETVIRVKPTVYSHNLETVRALTPKVRDPRCSFDQSLQVLRHVKTIDATMITKSSLMLGLGETTDDVLSAMDDLRAAGVDILTLGQYLQPTTKHVLVSEFVTPEHFDFLAEEGRKRGFAFVAAGPLVRSSYRAGELFIKNFIESRQSQV